MLRDPLLRDAGIDEELASERAKAASRVPGEDDGDEERSPRAAKLSLAPRAVLTPMSSVRRKPMRWLWRGRIPLGKITVLDGDPGNGKSTISLDIAARLSRGLPMPLEDEPTTGAADVILVSVEDDAADTIKPRLEAAGADCSRVHAMTIKAGDAEWLPALESYLPHIEQMISERQARLFILDPIAAVLGDGIDMHKDQDVRRVLGPVKAMAERMGCAVLAIRHFNKNSGASALHRGGGSIGIAGAARSVLAVGRDPKDEVKRVLATAKSNVAEALEVPSLSYRLEPVTLPAENGSPEVQTTRIEWLGTSTLTADDLVSTPPSNPEERSERQHAVAVVTEILTRGPALSKELEKEALAAGVASKRTLERGKQDLGVKYKSTPRGWISFLPTHTPPSPGTFGEVGEVDENDA